MPRRYVRRESALRSVGRAMERGKAFPTKSWRPRVAACTTVPHSWVLKYAGNCVNPVHLHRDGVVDRNDRTHVFGDKAERVVMTEIEARCRKCEPCLKARAAHWRLRAYTEYGRSERTWFGTLTLSPVQHFNVLTACRAEAARNGDDFDKFDTESQFRARHACISREITLYVKRLRKQSEAELKFLCVAEAHKSGLPHYHMLVHEVRGPIRHAVLSKQWRIGFSQWKLVPDRNAAGYVCKYLAKSSLARVRASLAYGE